MRSLNSLFPDWLTGGGIFSKLALLNVPWPTNISVKLDMEYHGNISGNKPISPLVSSLLGTADELTEAQKEDLAGVIYALCSEIWKKEYATLSYKYEPIENYSMVERMTDDTRVIDYGRTEIMSNNLTHQKTGTDSNSGTETTSVNKDFTDTRTPNLTTTETPTTTQTTENSTYGFNSSNSVPSDRHVVTDGGQKTTAQTGTDKTVHDEDTTGNRSSSDTITYNTTDTDTGTRSNENTGRDTETRNYTLTRSGNIGVTTSQQMIQSERELDMWNFFYSVVFPSVDKVLTLMIFN